MIKIRVARTDDIDGLMDLWRELAKTHEGLDPRFELVEKAEDIWREHILSVMKDQDCRVLVAVEAGALVGYVNGGVRNMAPIFLRRAHGNIDDLYVAKTHRRRGIATRLVEELLGWFWSRGITVYQTSFSVKNPEAEAFWQSAGFQESMRKVTRTAD